MFVCASYHYFIISKKVIVRIPRIPAIREKQAMQRHYYFISCNGCNTPRDVTVFLLSYVLLLFACVLYRHVPELKIAT